MFTGIRRRWKKLRASILRAELDYAAERFSQAADQHIMLSMGLHLAKLARLARERFGPLANIPDDQKRFIAKKFRRAAYEAFDLDISKGYAAFVLAAFYEAAGLMSDNAEYVSGITAKYISDALKVERAFDSPV